MAVASLLAPAPAAGAPETRAFGDARILAAVPPEPGFPEGIAVAGNRVYVAGAATFGTTGRGPSAVHAFDLRTGELEATYPVEGEDLLREHANSSIAFAGDGRLYVLNTQLGIYRLTPGPGLQERYTVPFPDLVPCALPVVGPPCSPTVADAPALPNDLAFDETGNLYVTDSLQATIWRVPAGPVPPGGKVPEIWFQDLRLASAYIGVNGIRFSPDRAHLYLTVTTDLAQRSLLYRLPVTSGLPGGDMTVVHDYTGDNLPDGIAFGRSGRLYVAMASPGRSGVSVLDPFGAEVARLANPAGSPLAPYDSPANVAFDHRGAILLSNHAFVAGAVDPGQFGIVEVFVDDRASPLATPVIP